MSNLLKITKHLSAIETAVNNVLYNNMPLEYLEDVFKLRMEYIQSAIDAEKFNKKEGK